MNTLSKNMNILNKSKNALKRVSLLLLGTILFICEAILLTIQIAIEPENNTLLYTAILLMIFGIICLYTGIKKKSAY